MGQGGVRAEPDGAGLVGRCSTEWPEAQGDHQGDPGRKSQSAVTRNSFLIHKHEFGSFSGAHQFLESPCYDLVEVDRPSLFHRAGSSLRVSAFRGARGKGGE